VIVKHYNNLSTLSHLK